MVRVLEDRVEITNPGVPLVDTRHFMDSSPRLRNESLASLMRRIGVCEERGSGLDKVVSLSVVYQLLASLTEVEVDHTHVVLFAPRPLAGMDRAEWIRASFLRCVCRNCWPTLRSESC